ncbi:MAG: hypothetical protein WKF88_05245 [Ferruginibacter sp.]
MKRLLLLLLPCFALTAFLPQKNITGEQILKKMYSRYSGNWYKNFTFTQTTENYRNDSPVKTATWYEAIVFPDYFRISFGDIKDGNAMLQIKDSVFNFRKGKMFRKSLKGQDHTFLLGGMYFIPFDSVKVRMEKEGYDISKAYESEWKGKKVYVLGANSAVEKTNQLWIEKDRLILVRFLKYEGANKEEAIFGDHKKFGKARSETSCSFFVNDKLIQTEKYNDCRVNTNVDMRLFDPYNFYQQ